jgi:DNA-binding NtrC family response regulator
VVLLDYKLNEDLHGLDLLKIIRKDYPDLPVIMVTQVDHTDIAVEAMHLGAIDFTTKQPNIKELYARLEQKIKDYHWKFLCQAKDHQYFGKMIYESPAMMQVVKIAHQVALKEVPVLLLGESGVGKGILAFEIHKLSSRKDRPFVQLNCSNLQPTLLESELFGHVRGAFTGAVTNKKGQLELAHTGTLFLDEIAAMPLESQAKILIALENQTFQPLGSVKQQTVDVRIIAASNKNLRDEVENKTFREDLYYRLNVMPIKVPPLRERPEDIIPLADYFLTTQTGPATRQFSANAKMQLQAYHWPGNVRELCNIIQRTAILTTELEIKQIQFVTEMACGSKLLNWENIVNLSYEQAKDKVLQHFQQCYFQHLLKVHSANMTSVAEAAGINRTTLYRILKGLGFSAPDHDEIQ